MMDLVVVKLRMNWASLREQKAELIKYAWKDADSNKLLEGIISIIDAIQDQAVEEIQALAASQKTFLLRP